MGGKQLNRFRSAAVYAVVVVFTMLSLSACGDRAATPIVQPALERFVPNVTVIRPQRRDAVRSITLPGDLVGFYETALHAKVTGYLKSIAVDKGDWVKAGQVLAEIEVPELRQNRARARAALELQRLSYQRLKKVRDTDPRLVAQEDVDIAYSKWAQAKAEVDVLETMVGYTKIVAPFAGVVTGRFVDPGALIQAGGGDVRVQGTEASVTSGAAEGAEGHKSGGGGPVLTLAAIDKLRVYIYVPEQEVTLIRSGMPAAISLQEFPDQHFTGVVTRFAHSLDLSTRTMLTEIDLDNRAHRLYPRMYASVTLELIRHPNAIQVPATAVELSGDTHFVYAVRNESLVKVPVSIGFSDGRYTEIVSGLTGQELLVSNISPALNDGEKVKAIVLNDAHGRAHDGEVASTH